MVTALLRAQILKFLLSGGTAALANAGTGFLVRLVIHGELAYDVSVVSGFVVGTVVSFVLNRSITFEATGGDLARQIRRYVLAAIVGIAIATLVAIALSWLLRALFAQWLVAIGANVIHTAAHVGAIGLVTIYNFIAVKYYAFSASPPRPLPAAATKNAAEAAVR